MSERRYSFADRLLTETDHALRTVAAPARARNPRPDGDATADAGCERPERAARLMRVNHSGEVAAQALYRGQALVTRDPALRDHLLRAADEEHDHLAWCGERARELGGRTSVLAPLWYAGSFVIGALAGLAGDRTSLGFLAETERQVVQHLDDHLERLGTDDVRSRRILERMRSDELAHGTRATAMGGRRLPLPVRAGMRLASRVMTCTSYRA